MAFDALIKLAPRYRLKPIGVIHVGGHIQYDLGVVPIWVKQSFLVGAEVPDRSAAIEHGT